MTIVFFLPVTLVHQVWNLILQLKRRCGTYMHVERDIIHVYRFDSTLQDYSFVGDCLNPLEKFLQAQPASPTFTDDELLTSLGLSRKPYFT